MNQIEPKTKGIRLEVNEEMYKYLKDVQNKLREAEKRKRPLSELVLMLVERGISNSEDVFSEGFTMYKSPGEATEIGNLAEGEKDSGQNKAVQSDSQLNSAPKKFKSVEEADAEWEKQAAIRRQIIKENKEMVIRGQLYNEDFVQKEFPFPEFSQLAFQDGNILPSSRNRLPIREARSLLNKPQGMSDYEWLMTPHVQWNGRGIDKYAPPTAFPWPDHYHIVFDWADNFLNECIRKLFKITRKKNVKLYDLESLYGKVQDFLLDEMYKKVLPIQYPYRRAFEVLLLDGLNKLIMLFNSQEKEEMPFKWRSQEKQDEYLQILLWLDSEANLHDDWLERMTKIRKSEWRI